jgi:sulfatase modifying factor 1
MWRFHSARFPLLRALFTGGVCWSSAFLSGGEAPSGAASIVLRPRVVHAGCAVTATFVLADGSTLPRFLEGTDRAIRWKADGGLLLYDDLPEIEWRAPAKKGPYTLKAALTRGAGVVEAELKVHVRSPSFEGMVRVPAGAFIRGDQRGTKDTREYKSIQNTADEPAHSVYLDEFWIDRYLVTNQKYKKFLEAALKQGMLRIEEIAVMGLFENAWVPFYYFQSFEHLIRNYYATRNARNPSFAHVMSIDGGRFSIEPGKENHPVVDVSWFGAAAYARFCGKRLPTEAQWEKAARGPYGNRYPWGNHLPTAYHAPLNFYFGPELTPVGFYSPVGDSPYGVADMLGGCWEWTRDWFQPRHYQDSSGKVPLLNPRGPFWGRSHGIRGPPSGVTFPPYVDGVEPVSTRYSWRFEFLIADCFANRETGFRTAIDLHDGG